MVQFKRYYNKLKNPSAVEADAVIDSTGKKVVIRYYGVMQNGVRTVVGVNPLLNTTSA